MKDDNIISFEIKNNQIIVKTDDGQIRAYNYNEKNNTLKSYKEDYIKYKSYRFIIKILKECIQVVMFLNLILSIIVSECFVILLEAFGILSLMNMVIDETINCMDENYYSMVNEYKYIKTEVYQPKKEEPKPEKKIEKTKNYDKNIIRKLKDMREYLLSLKGNIEEKPKTNIKNLK